MRIYITANIPLYKTKSEIASNSLVAHVSARERLWSITWSSVGGRGSNRTLNAAILHREPRDRAKFYPLHLLTESRWFKCPS